MNLYTIGKVLAVLALTGPVLSGCKEDPPPPPLPEPSKSAKGKDGAPTLDPQARFRSTQVPKISPETMKAYRVETCYFGAMGLRVARDAYAKSLGGAEPGPGKIPSFGEYPENKKLEEQAKQRAEEAKKRGDKVHAARGPVFASRQLPFLRHLRSCSVAKTLKNPKYEGLDEALTEFDAYASTLQRALLDANRYYERDRAKEDDFKRGKELHKTLTTELATLDERLAKFGAAVEEWHAKLPAPPEKPDQGGELSEAAVADARALTLAMLAEAPDAEAVARGLERLKKAEQDLVARAAEAKIEAHPKIMPPKIKELIAAVEAASAIKGKRSSAELYPVTAAMAELIEANHRGLAQMLRSRGDTEDGGPMRLMKPRMKMDGARPRRMPEAPADVPPTPE